MKSTIIKPDYEFYNNLPSKDLLFNPLIDIPVVYKEDSEYKEFYKLSNEFFSPEFGIKYLLNVKLLPYQMSTIRAILKHKFPLLLCSRGGAKSFMLAVAAIYYAIFNPGHKVAIVSASLRQAKFVFNYIIKIHKESQLLRDLSDKEPKISNDRCYYDVNNSTIVALPLGQGDKIRGERANFIIADEFNSIPIEIFDIVVRGFGATASDPYEKVKQKLLKKKGEITDLYNTNNFIATGNKIVISGTAGFRNEPLYRMYKQYSVILGNKIKGNAGEFAHLLGEEMDSKEFLIDYRDYCIIKYDYKEIPEDFLEEKIIHNARATMPKILFNMEYLCEFADDSAGFFKARDIKEATYKYPDGYPVLISGRENKSYIMGVDPARVTDRFAISLIEMGSPNKIVYIWTCQNKKFSESVAKMRYLMRNFNVIGIAMDAGGGGYAVAELLQLKELMEANDKPIYAYDLEGPMPVPGDKILYMLDFSSSWIEEANVLLQKNIEDKVLMFPMEIVQNNNDDIDMILEEIRDLKRELVSIEVTYTKTGKRHFDLMPPDVKTGADDIVRHKDRYSSLLLSNYLCNKLSKNEIDVNQVNLQKYYSAPGGWVEDF